MVLQLPASRDGNFRACDVWRRIGGQECDEFCAFIRSAEAVHGYLLLEFRSEDLVAQCRGIAVGFYYARQKPTMPWFVYSFSSVQRFGAPSMSAKRRSVIRSLSGLIFIVNSFCFLMLDKIALSLYFDYTCTSSYFYMALQKNYRHPITFS